MNSWHLNLCRTERKVYFNIQLFSYWLSVQQCFSMTCRHVPVTCRWGSPSFLLAEFCCCRSKNRATVRLRQRSTNVQPMRRKVISLKQVKLRVDT